MAEFRHLKYIQKNVEIDYYKKIHEKARVKISDRIVINNYKLY